MLFASKIAQAQLKEARATLKARKITQLLADPLSNPKVAKGGKIGVLTAPLHLAPASLSGFNVCPMASQGCIRACLNTAGNPAYAKGKRAARNRKTKAYFQVRDAFMTFLVREIELHERSARKQGMMAAVRLNATSDIPWEKVPVKIGRRTFANIMAAFPRVTFYDYTARHNRRDLPKNYTLTYSLKEDNEHRVSEALANGMNVAVVFNVKRLHPLPGAYELAGIPLAVIDGDEHDYRPADPCGAIVGLRAKGKAIKDKSGFVRKVA